MSGLLINERGEGDPGEEPASDRHADGAWHLRELRGELGELLCAYRSAPDSHAPRGGAILWVAVALLLWAGVMFVGLAWPE